MPATAGGARCRAVATLQRLRLNATAGAYGSILGAMTEASERIAAAVRVIPAGCVLSYGAVAAAAGLPNGARAVARLLHAASSSRGLPWWRVVRADGRIALPRGGGFEEQAARLAAEGLMVGPDGKVRKA